jgi:hypothetical protein
MTGMASSRGKTGSSRFESGPLGDHLSASAVDPTRTPGIKAAPPTPLKFDAIINRLTGSPRIVRQRTIRLAQFCSYEYRRLLLDLSPRDHGRQCSRPHTHKENKMSRVAFTDDELITRATRALLRRSRRDSFIFQQPSSGAVTRYARGATVILYDGVQSLARYRTTGETLVAIWLSPSEPAVATEPLRASA